MATEIFFQINFKCIIVTLRIGLILDCVYSLRSKALSF